MTDQTQPTDDSSGSAPDANGTRFRWHPVYKGCAVEGVRRDLVDEIRRDQRAYNLALEGAEKDEHGSLQSIMKLDARWCDYDFGWTEADVSSLADRVIAVEQERERRQQMIPVRELRASLDPVSVAASAERGEEPDEAVAGSLHIPRWAYIAVTILVVIGLIALLIQVF